MPNESPLAGKGPRMILRRQVALTRVHPAQPIVAVGFFGNISVRTDDVAPRRAVEAVTPEYQRDTNMDRASNVGRRDQKQGLSFPSS